MQINASGVREMSSGRAPSLAPSHSSAPSASTGAKATLAEFDPDVQELANSVKGYIRMSVTYGEWPPLHFLKHQMDEWAWTITCQVLKDNPSNTSFKNAYNSLANAENNQLRRRFLTYVRSLLLVSVFL